MDKKETGKVTFKKLVIPFDLDQIFSIQYSVSGLKMAIEFILENLGDQNEKYNSLLDMIEKYN